MPDLYLILHKVRGEPAFDVAYKYVGNNGEDLGWLIPTSGHGAHPAQAWRLDTLKQMSFEGTHAITTEAANDPRWADLPDHYRVTAAPPPPPLTLESLGIKPTQIRRKLG